jgi:phosphatidylserine/phosphatidylglycerophosphate/cardiolipin synthase-like enzyme
MKFTEDTKHRLVPYIIGDNHSLYRTGEQLISLFNEFGCNDSYREGLPINSKTKHHMSRKEYVEDRLCTMDDDNIIGLLSKVISESENIEKVVEEIRKLIRKDGYDISNNDGTYFISGGVIDRTPPVVNQAHFQDIEDKILTALDEAKVSIKLSVAWFTNKRLINKLLEKQKQGLDIQIIIADDDINRKHSSNFGDLKVFKRGRVYGGLMHNKFCVIDNQVVITGSYNWTNRAEFENYENITIEKDIEQATRYSVEFRELLQGKPKTL